MLSQWRSTGAAVLLICVLGVARCEETTTTARVPTSVPTVAERADADPTLVQYAQPNDIASGRYDNISVEEAERIGLCARPCDNATPLICYFVFTLENYATVGPACGDCLKGKWNDCYKKGCVTADGFERAILSINRQLPGPSIQVCKGDTIVVDVKNHMLDREVTFHWHGMYMRETPWMDGVPMVTQCPIPVSTTFRYKFPAHPVGTFFYQSHVALQKMDGLEGSLIIRSPKSLDGNRELYDFDLFSHVIILSDWMHQMTDSHFPGNTYNDTRVKADALLINGQNKLVNGPEVEMHTFSVQSGKRYLFRIVGGSCLACPLIFTIEKHPLHVIGADGTSVEPFYVDSITLFPGDRVDVVVETNQTAQLYWMQARTMCDNITAEAVLQYEGDGLTFLTKHPNSSTFSRGKSLNAMDLNPNCTEGAEGVCWSQVNALKPPLNQSVLKEAPDKTLIIALDEFYFTSDALFWKDNSQYYKFLQTSPIILTHLINNFSFVMPAFPQLVQGDPLPPDLVCPADSSQCVDQSGLPNGRLCDCFNTVQVELGQIVEIILIDWGNAKLLHPMHLHGTDMFIREQGTKPADVDNRAFIEQLKARLALEAANLTLSRPQPCVKDTVTIPPGGYAVVRVHFDNPGLWLCNSHYIFHSDTGMSMVFQVGTRDQFVPPPPDFPKCNNFKLAVNPAEFANVNWDDEPTTL